MPGASWAITQTSGAWKNTQVKVEKILTQFIDKLNLPWKFEIQCLFQISRGDKVILKGISLIILPALGSRVTWFALPVNWRGYHHSRHLVDFTLVSFWRGSGDWWNTLWHFNHLASLSSAENYFYEASQKNLSFFFWKNRFLSNQLRWVLEDSVLREHWNANGGAVLPFHFVKLKKFFWLSIQRLRVNANLWWMDSFLISKPKNTLKSKFQWHKKKIASK